MFGHIRDENYGDNRKDSSSVAFHCALRSLFEEYRILLLGIFQSCFESVMYIFVFMWTPALQLIASRDIPHGECILNKKEKCWNVSFMLIHFIRSSIFLFYGCIDAG